ncbi:MULTISPECIES: C40 family peptidase [Emticicia]|uniref:C40 family peptidase n=1 Tax=Emticicia TaxID=312278 RepID=UPI0009EF4B6E|nr:MULTISPECIES: C40 family peptidase [Emticicia]
MLIPRKYISLITIVLTLLFVSSCKATHSKKIEPSLVKEHIYTKKIIQIARNYKGVPYKSGGNDIRGLDCSGLICLVYKEIGIKLPRTSWQQSDFFPAINLPNIQKGDLVFFVTIGSDISHAGIVTEVISEDNIRFIHASTSKGVIEDNMMTNYWKSRFARVCRPTYPNTLAL